MSRPLLKAVNKYHPYKSNTKMKRMKEASFKTFQIKVNPQLEW
jgi:hypothetical protein